MMISMLGHQSRRHYRADCRRVTEFVIGSGGDKRFDLNHDRLWSHCVRPG